MREQLPPLEHQRGYFGAFMAGYGRADAATRARVGELVGLWHAGLLDGPHLIVRVSALLGIPAYTGKPG